MNEICLAAAAALAGILLFRLGYQAGQRRLGFTLALGNLAIAAILARALRDIAAGNPDAAAATIRPLVEAGARGFEAIRSRIPARMLAATNADRLLAEAKSPPRLDP